MARYDLPKYQSMYRDPQSVAINTELRQRYVEKFAGADALQGAVDDMTSADFEGDKLEKQKLVDKYNAKLNEMSSQGDYESMGMRVANNARDFVQDYKPVQKNKKKYDDYIIELDRLRKAGIAGGGISEFVYTRKIAEAKHGYYGLQRNEEGKIDEGSYFSGPGVVKSVDYIKVLDDALTGIKPDKASTVFDIPQDQLVLDQYGRLNVNPMVDRETGNIIYWVETTEGRVEVSADRVQRIVGDVLADPSVRMSMEQDAHLTTFDMSQEDITATLDEEFAKLDKQILEAKTDEDKEALEERKQEWLDKQANEGDLSLVRSLTRNNIMYRALDASVAKHAYLETERKKLLDYDDDYVRSQTDLTNKSVPAVNLFADASEQSGLGGDTFKKKTEYVITTQSVIDDSYTNLLNKNKVYADEKGVDAKTLEDIQTELHNIQNAEEFEELAKSYNMTPENFRGEVNKILENESRVNLVNQKIEEATKELFGDTYNEDISAEYENKEVSGYKGSKSEFSLSYKKIRDTLISMGEIEAGSSIKDALDYLNRQPTKQIPGSSSAYGGGAYYPAIADDILQYLADNEGLVIKPKSKGATVGGTRESNQQLFRNVSKNYTERMEEDNEKLNKEFSKQIKTDALIIKDFGTKDDGGIKNTEYVKKQFKSIFWDESQKRGVFPPGMKIRTQNGSYEGDWATYMDQQSMWGDADYTINIEGIGLSNVPSVDGKQMLYVPIKFTSGKQEGKTTYFLVDSSQLQSDELDDWMNSAEFQVQKMYARGEWANVSDYAPEMFSNVEFQYAKYDKNGKQIQKEKIYIDLPDDDTDELIEHDKAEGLAVLATVYANLGYADLFNEIKRKRGLR